MDIQRRTKPVSISVLPRPSRNPRKTELAHLDRPSAMLGAFENETAARTFHEKLVPWMDWRLKDGGGWGEWMEIRRFWGAQSQWTSVDRIPW